MLEALYVHNIGTILRSREGKDVSAVCVLALFNVPCNVMVLDTENSTRKTELTFLEGKGGILIIKTPPLTDSGCS